MIDDSALLEELRPYAFSIAYRMLGSVAEAEDVVQEALVRVHGAVEAGTRFESPRAYVATVTTRLALDQLKSARVRRETYVGSGCPSRSSRTRAPTPNGTPRWPTWCPTPSSPSSSACRRSNARRSCSGTSSSTSTRRSPRSSERLRKIARQLASRARRHVTEGRPRFEASREDHRALVTSFLAAVDHGDVQALERMLAQDVVLHGDGGGKVPAVMRPLAGRDHAIRTLAAWWRAGMAGRAVARAVEVNGEPGAVLRDAAGDLVGVIAIEVRDGLIVAIRSVVNPDKLQHLGPVGDMHALLARDG